MNSVCSLFQLSKLQETLLACDVSSLTINNVYPSIFTHSFSLRYDPYVPKAGSSGRIGGDPAGGTRGNDNINRAQMAVDEATGVMRDNIRKVTERGERMDDLKTKTGESTTSFKDVRFVPWLPIV